MTDQTNSEQEPQTPFAILYLPDAKAGQTIPVYGRTAKRYSFAPSPLVSNKPARVYFDPEAFAREELDLRRNIKPTAVICVSIGPANPLIRAESAVSTLIKSKQTVGAGAVRDGLLRIIQKANEALETLNETVPQASGATVQLPEPTTSTSIAAAVADASPEQQKPEPLPVLNEPSLMVMDIDKLRELCKACGVSARSRVDMVAGYLRKQAEAQPA